MMNDGAIRSTFAVLETVIRRMEKRSQQQQKREENLKLAQQHAAWTGLAFIAKLRMCVQNLIPETRGSTSGFLRLGLG